MEKVLAVENRPVLLAGIALGGIAAAIFMKRLGPMRVLGIARCARHRQLWFLGLHVVRGWRGGAEPAGAAQRILMRQAHARRSTAPPLARQTRAGRRTLCTARITRHGARLQNPGHVLRIMWCVCVCVCCVLCMSLAGTGTRSGCGARRTADPGALPSTKARAPSMSTSRSVCTCEHRVGP
jgi:hypothetical protein